MSKTIFAYTPPGAEPPYVNLSQHGDEYVLLVRSRGSQYVATMQIPEGQLRNFALDILTALPDRGCE